VARGRGDWTAGAARRGGAAGIGGAEGIGPRGRAKGRRGRAPRGLGSWDGRRGEGIGRRGLVEERASWKRRGGEKLGKQRERCFSLFSANTSFPSFSPLEEATPFGRACSFWSFFGEVKAAKSSPK